MAITRVQSKTANTAATNTTSLTLTFDATPTAGNVIILAVTAGTASNAISRMTDQTGITWQNYPSTQAPGTTTILGRIASSIASATVTINNTATSPIAVVGVEYSGINIRPDKQKQANGTSTSAASGATETTTSANELWVGAMSARGQNANTMSAPTNSFSIVAQTNTTNGTSNADVTCGFLERIVTSTGTANAGVTITSNTWMAQVMTFEEVSSVAGGSSYTYGG